MTDELNKAIKQIKKLSPSLNAAADEANAIVQRVEAFLADECSVGIGADYCFASEGRGEPDDDQKQETYLSYARIAGKYRFGIQTVLVKNASMEGQNAPSAYACTCTTETLVPWASCSREEKLKAFPVLPGLLTMIADTMSEQIKTANETCKVVEDVLKAMGDKPVKATGKTT